MAAANPTTSSPSSVPPAPAVRRRVRHRPLTPKAIEHSLRPREAAYDVPDGGAPGLVLRVHPSGVRVFRWPVRALHRWVILGPWAATPTSAHLTLREAREWFGRLKEARAAGVDQLDKVAGELERRLKPPPDADPAAAASDSVRSVADSFYERRILPHRKRPQEARSVLDKDILPIMGARPIAAVTTAECAALVERVVDRPAPAWGGKVLGLLKQLFAFAERRDLIQRNPAARLDADELGIVVGVRKRCLDDPHLRHKGEIAAFWKALDAEPVPTRVERPDPRTGKVQDYAQRLHGLTPTTRRALKLLLLTGVRSGELRLARWEHVDFDKAIWTIPVENQKLTPKAARNARPFQVPLSPTALALFRELKDLAEGKGHDGKDSPWVLASEDADCGHYDDKSVGRAMKRLFENKNPILTLPGGPASPHDLRRTMRTHLGRLKVPLHIVERCLNHALGRMVQIYDVNDYLDERGEALELWDAYLMRLVTGKGAEVVPLPAAEARP